MIPQSAVSQGSLETLEFLKQPSSYPNHPVSIDLRETHISWVFLAGRDAYKLKKPVRFDFLDFSTSEFRRKACEAELRLNRRLSPSVYRAVVPICRSTTGKLSIGGAGEPVDWLVKMRRLDDRRTLESVLQKPDAARIADTQIRNVAALLARFYVGQAPVTVRTGEFRERLRQHVEENEHELLQIDSLDSARNAIRLVHSAQKRFLVVHRETLDDRVRDGRIVDGHGDLRPAHVYFYHEPLVIDCIEFSDEYRTNDIADELAFLAMECDRLNTPAVGKVLFEAYSRASNDVVPERLVAFYKAYRACVRAKVSALRSRQLDATGADSTGAESARSLEHQYLRLAEQYVPKIEPRLVVLVGGLMGTGKSTLAAQLGELLSADVISSDVVRQYRPDARPETNLEFGEGKYSLESRLEVYQSLISQAVPAMAHNNVVILDATFSKIEMRQLAIDFAEAFGAKVLQVECICSREVALQRIADRAMAGGSASEAQPEHYDMQAAEAEHAPHSIPLVNVDTTLALGRQRAMALELVRSACQ